MLELTRRVWAKGEGDVDVPVGDLPAEHPGPALVLRALLSTGTAYLIEGGMAELDEICWRDIVLETSNGRRVVLREEGLRGDDYRTALRAINRWRETHKATDDVTVVDIRISKSQPRPVPAEE